MEIKTETTETTVKVAEMAISVSNLVKTYPGRMALNGISFEVRKGSVHGFLGPNGAGKSTTMKILSGLIKESFGSFEVSGKVGFLPEHPPLYPNMTVKDFLNFVFDIYSLKKAEKENSVNSIINKTGLLSVKDRLIGNLSKGFQQRVGIAEALVHSPEIIILDEPTVGLDPMAIVEIRNLISELKNEHTILFSTHQLHDVELLCSDITLINHGKIVVSGPLESILEDLKTRMVLGAKVCYFSSELKEEMINRFQLESLSFAKDSSLLSETIQLQMTVNNKNILKQEIAQFLANEKIGLLEFTEIKPDLEEIFKQMVLQ